MSFFKNTNLFFSFTTYYTFIFVNCLYNFPLGFTYTLVIFRFIK